MQSRQNWMKTEPTRKLNDVADEFEDLLYEIVSGRSEGIDA